MRDRLRGIVTHGAAERDAVRLHLQVMTDGFLSVDHNSTEGR
jgi:hypothetical protein